MNPPDENRASLIYDYHFPLLTKVDDMLNNEHPWKVGFVALAEAC